MSEVEPLQFGDLAAWLGGGYINIEDDDGDHVTMTLEEAAALRDWLTMVLPQAETP